MLRIVPRTIDEANTLFTGIPAGQTNRWLAIVPDGRAGREISNDLSQAALGCGLRFRKILELNAAQTNAEFIRSQVLTSGGSVVLLWLDPLHAGKLASHLKTAGYRGTLAGPGWLQCGSFITAAGDALDGFIVPAIVKSVESGARWQSFQTSYQERWDHAPGMMAAMSYDAAMLLNYLLRQPQFQTPPHRLAPGFAWPGMTGELNFDTAGNRLVKLELLQAHDGRFSRMR